MNFEEKLKRLPKVGSIVKTSEGEGVIESVETLKEQVRVKIQEDAENYKVKKFDAKDVKVIKDTEEKQENDDNNIEQFEDVKGGEADGI